MFALCFAGPGHNAFANEASLRLMQEAAPLISATPPRPLEALDKLRAATKADPRDAAAWFVRGAYALSLYLAKEALESLDKAAALDPKRADLQYLRGRALQELGRSGPALAAFAREPNKDGNPLYYFYRGLAGKVAGKFPDALSDFDRSDNVYPSGRQATQLHRGDIYVAQGKIAAAQEAYRKVSTFDPASPMVKTAETRLKALRKPGAGRR